MFNIRKSANCFEKLDIAYRSIVTMVDCKMSSQLRFQSLLSIPKLTIMAT